MSQQHYSEDEDSVANNKRSLKSLERAITMSEGQFSLILAYSNCTSLRRKVVKQLKELSSVQLRELTLHPSVNTLFTTILTTVKEPTSALMVFGLESVVAIDELLIATNLVRDEFRKQFPFPIVLWIDDEVLQKMIRLAPDFKNWAATPIRFEVPKFRRDKILAITA
jgi:hypothetical protein